MFDSATNCVRLVDRMKLPTKTTKPGVEIDHARAGAIIRDMRESANMPLRELARRMNVSATYLSGLERAMPRCFWDQDKLDAANDGIAEFSQENK